MTNNSWIPLPWLTGLERLPLSLSPGKIQRWVLSLKPGETKEIRYPVTGRNRGVYQVGPLQISIGDPLGLHRVTGDFAHKHQVVIYPAIYPLAKLGLPSPVPFGNLQDISRIHQDPTRLQGIREYQRGDSPKQIHWKASARTGQLQVKEYEHTLTLNSVLFLNLNEDDYEVSTVFSDSELAIETTASLAHHLARQGHSFAFVTSNQQLPTNKGTHGLVPLLECLAALECKPAPQSFPKLIRQQGQKLPWGSLLLVVVPNDTPELIEECLTLTRRGFRVLVFVTGPKITHNQWLTSLRPKGLQLFHATRQSQTGLTLSQS